MLSTISLPDVLAEWSIDVTLARVFSEILGVLDAYAKPFLFITMLVVQVIVGGVFGVLYPLVLWISEWVAV